MSRTTRSRSGKSDDLEHQVGTIKATIEAFGSVDLLVNNNGINPAYGALVDLDLDAARKIVEVNCLAALSWGQQAHRAWMGEHVVRSSMCRRWQASSLRPSSASMARARRCSRTSPPSSRSSSARASASTRWHPPW